MPMIQLNRLCPVLCLVCVISDPVFAASVPSVDDPLPSHSSSPEDAAVVVGNEDYAYLPDVPYAARDAQAFGDWLIHTRGLRAERVHMLVNASHATMKDAIDAVAYEVGQGGILWVYFAGHGAGAVFPDGGTERALIGKSAEADSRTFDDFVVRISEIEAMATRSKASQVILVLDACYANANRDGGAVIGGRFVVPASAVATPPRVTLWSAVSGSEVAEAYSPAQHGLFTYFVLSALRGQADGAFGSTDGTVTLDEARTWVSRAVRIVGDHRQNPEISMDPQASGIPLVTGLAGITPMDPESLPKGGTSGADALREELERIRQLQEQERATQNQRSVRAAQDRVDLLAEASANWETTRSLAAQGGETSEMAVRRYIATYENASITVDGAQVAVAVPEVQEARKLLTSLMIDDHPSSGRGRLALRIGSGVSLLGGGALLVVTGLKEAAVLESIRTGEITVSETDSLQGSINTRYLVGYGLAGLGGGLAVGSFLALSPLPGPGLLVTSSW